MVFISVKTRYKQNEINKRLQTNNSSAKTFWIEIAWRISEDDGTEEEEWTPCKKRHSINSANVVWWPALVSKEPINVDVYCLFYSISCWSSSEKDLNKNEQFRVKFEGTEWLKHVGGSENGKRCVWRYAEWEMNEVVQQEESRIGKDVPLEVGISELKGCYLEIIHELRKEKRARLELADRVKYMERGIPSSGEYNITGKVRSYLSNSLLSALAFDGTDSRGRSDVNAYSNSYVQVMARTKTVDCTLAEYRELARDASERAEGYVKFNQTKFSVLSFGMRHKKKMTMKFDSFHAMCHALKLNYS